MHYFLIINEKSAFLKRINFLEGGDSAHFQGFKSERGAIFESETVKVESDWRII